MDDLDSHGDGLGQPTEGLAQPRCGPVRPPPWQCGRPVKFVLRAGCCLVLSRPSRCFIFCLEEVAFRCLRLIMLTLAQVSNPTV